MRGCAGGGVPAHAPAKRTLGSKPCALIQLAAEPAVPGSLSTVHPWPALKQEVDALGGAEPAFEDLAGLKYTEAALLEAMRLYPPVSSFLALVSGCCGGGIAVPPHGGTASSTGTAGGCPADMCQPRASTDALVCCPPPGPGAPQQWR